MAQSPLSQTRARQRMQLDGMPLESAAHGGTNDRAACAPPQASIEGSPGPGAMLTRHPQLPRDAGGAMRAPVWLDLVSPNDEERSHAADLLGRELPTRDQISSLALSNRVRTSDQSLSVNIPGFVRGDHGRGVMTPLGIVLTPALLVTLRYADSPSFDRLAHGVAQAAEPPSSVEVFVALFESVAETAVDRMQALSNDLSKLSREVFSDSKTHAQMLRSVLFQIGGIQRQLTQLRAAMLGVQRGLAHLCDTAPAWIDQGHVARLHVVLSDLRSLAEFDDQMDDKVQFVLDATLGFINNEQNDIIRVLTVASVVTIPPMILAGIWGMNFKTIAEYSWEHGYAFAWAMIILSMLLPLAWFKWKRWF